MTTARVHGIWLSSVSRKTTHDVTGCSEERTDTCVCVTTGDPVQHRRVCKNASRHDMWMDIKGRRCVAFHLAIHPAFVVVA